MSMDQPVYVTVMQVTRLADGYVINAMGHTVACRDARDLGRKITKLAQDLEHVFIHTAPGDPAVTEPPIPTTSSPPSTGVTEGRDPAFGAVTDALMSTTPSARLSLDDQRSQMDVVIDTYTGGLITEERFQEAREKYFPDVPADDLNAALNAAEQELIGGQNGDAGATVPADEGVASSPDNSADVGASDGTRPAVGAVPGDAPAATARAHTGGRRNGKAHKGPRYCVKCGHPAGRKWEEIEPGVFAHREPCE